MKSEQPIRIDLSLDFQHQIVCNPELMWTDLFVPDIPFLIANNSSSNAMGIMTNNGNHPSRLC